MLIVFRFWEFWECMASPFSTYILGAFFSRGWGELNHHYKSAFYHKNSPNHLDWYLFCGDQLCLRRTTAAWTWSHRTHVSRKSCEADYNTTVGTVGTKEDQVAFLVSRVSQIPQL